MCFLNLPAVDLSSELALVRLRPHLGRQRPPPLRRLALLRSALQPCKPCQKSLGASRQQEALSAPPPLNTAAAAAPLSCRQLPGRRMNTGEQGVGALLARLAEEGEPIAEGLGGGGAAMQEAPE